MSIQVIDKIKPLGNFKIADATDIEIEGIGLDEKVANIEMNAFSGNYNDLSNKPTIPTKTSQLQNDSNFSTFSGNYSDLNGKPDLFDGNYNSLTNKPIIPTRTSELLNDSGYMTEYTEIDPTVPDWARTPNKPTYTKEEIGLSNVDNTSDADKPISTATQTAINALANSKKRIFLSAFFDGSASLNFYTTENLIDYEKINAGFENARDASLFEKDGVLYIAYTGGDETSDFEIAKTTDLVNFEKTKVNLGLNKERNRWAPALAEINGQIYLTITSRTDSDSYIYMCKFNLDDYTYTELKRLTLDNNNVIDSEIFKFKDKVYMMVKDEVTKKTRLYSTSDMDAFTFIRTMDEFPSGLNKSEGAFPLVLGDMIFIGVDNYDSPTYSRSLQLGYFYSNIEIAQQGNGYILNTQDYLARHGSTIELKSNSLIISAETKHITNTGMIKRFQIQELKYYASNGVIDELYVFPDVVYVVWGSEQYTINKLYNPFGCDNFMLQFRANVGSAWVKIVNNGVKTTNCAVINSDITNEKIIEFKWSKDGFYLVNHYEPPLHAITSLSVGSTQINPESNNEVYHINEDGDYTVTLLSKKVKDIFVYSESIHNGILDFDGNSIDLSLLPPKSLIHFTKYGSVYFPLYPTYSNSIIELVTRTGAGTVWSSDSNSINSSAYIVKETVSIPAGNYTLRFNSTSVANSALKFFDESNTQIKNYDIKVKEGFNILEISIAKDAKKMEWWVNASSTITFSEIAVQTPNKPTNTYIPYAPTNAELYAMIKQITAQIN